MNLSQLLLFQCLITQVVLHSVASSKHTPSTQGSLGRSKENNGTECPVGTQTRTRSDRKYSIPERARRAIINYLSRYKTLRISVRACPPVQGKPGTVGQKYPP